MKLQQLTLLSLALATTTIYSSNDATTYSASLTRLSTAKNALLSLINPSYSNEGVGTVQTTITNNASPTVYLMVFDQNNAQINSTITLTSASSTYIPTNAVSIKLVDINKKELVGTTPIQTNRPYSITLINNKWEITGLNTIATYSYTNKTNIPLIVKITTNNVEIIEQVAPSNSFSQTINPSTALARETFIATKNFKLKYTPMLSIEVHADLTGLSMMFNSNASYEIGITNNKLSCKQTAATGNTVMNKTGWPMFVDVTTNSDDDLKHVTLQNGNSFKPNIAATKITIIPAIENQSSGLTAAKSFTIASTQGVLTF